MIKTLSHGHQIRIPYVLGFLLSAMHLAGTVVLHCFCCMLALPVFDNTTEVTGLVEDSGIVVPNILAQPMEMLAESLIGKDMPPHAMGVSFALNSLVWGFCLAYLVIYIRRCRSRKHDSLTAKGLADAASSGVAGEVK